MADVVEKAVRSRMMAAVRTRDTAPELLVRRFLHAAGFRFRLHVRDLPGCPDIVLPKYQSVIFVHGCFWHQHSGCPKARLPATNYDFWKAKLESNVVRDSSVRDLLLRQGWQVIVVWECSLRDPDQLDTLPSQIRSFVPK
jgi:DNA mismatch endonuclease, patch repair protein